MKHEKDIARFIRNGDFELTEEGVLIHSAIMARHYGRYVHSVNGGQDVRIDHNLIPAEGIAHVLNTVWGAEAKQATWYVALFSGNVTPGANWTAANFAAAATEITSLTEGYSQATRPEFVDAAASGGVLGNLAARAVFSIVCTSALNIYGAALLSSSVRGGTSGILSSASRYASVRTVANGDSYEVGYEVELTDS